MITTYNWQGASYPERQVDYSLFVSPSYLPTSNELIQTFQGAPAAWSSLVGEVSIRGQFFCEYYTSDYIDQLASVIHNCTDGQANRPILELGAGAGRLSYFLRQRLGGLSIIATDEYASGPDHMVESIDYRIALRNHDPALVLCAWMPKGEDWTTDIRNTASVTNYILIGPAGIGSACGSDDTWKPELYAADGFTATVLNDLAAHQFNSLSDFRPPTGPIKSGSTTV